MGGILYEPLNVGTDSSEKTGADERNVTLFANAGVLSKLSFWWLNPLMRKGKEKTLEDDDMPLMRQQDRAKTCFSVFSEQLEAPKEVAPDTPPPILWTLILNQWKGILVSGLWALLKVLTMSAGPLLLNAFVKVADGEELFKHGGYILALSLFVAKCMESLAQRMWYFRSRVIGIQIRGIVSAAIFRKQMRLSNASRGMHSSGAIMSYVTVDAYRIGEFPYWFHQTWSTSLQVGIALAILIHAVKLATLAALGAIILTVIVNTPLAKLQNKFQTKLMAAQDVRLKATSESLINKKVLKLYAWETHFKKVIEKLRIDELKWLSAVQLQKSYNGFLFWLSPLLVSVSTFSACYFLGIPLHAGNVFTFVATLRLLQDPISSIPDVIGVIIQANVSLARIIKFLEAPELEKESVRRKANMKEIEHSMMRPNSWGIPSSRLMNNLLFIIFV